MFFIMFSNFILPPFHNVSHSIILHINFDVNESRYIHIDANESRHIYIYLDSLASI